MIESDAEIYLCPICGWSTQDAFETRFGEGLPNGVGCCCVMCAPRVAPLITVQVDLKKIRDTALINAVRKGDVHTIKMKVKY